MISRTLSTARILGNACCMLLKSLHTCICYWDRCVYIYCKNNQSSHVYYIYNKCHKNVCINKILIHAYSINTKSSHIFILPPSKKYLHLQACHIFKKDKMNNLQVKKPQKSTISNIVSLHCTMRITHESERGIHIIHIYSTVLLTDLNI